MTPSRSEKFTSLTMEETHSQSIWEDRDFQKPLTWTNPVNNSLVIAILHVMRSTQANNWMLMVESSISEVLMFILKITSCRNTAGTSQSAQSANQHQETLSLSKYHHIMASVMKSIPLVTCTISCLRNQRLISSSTSITIKKFSDIQLVSTQKSQRMLIEDSSSHST